VEDLQNLKKISGIVVDDLLPVLRVAGWLV
jgi:hypothetical protein